MKTQIKRFSKSTLAVVLTLCMLVSCMTVGIIATDAARVQSESVGWNVYVPKGTVYFDFTDVGINTSQQYDSSKRGVNYATSTTNQAYNANGGGTVISYNYSSAISSTTTSVSFIKTDVGNWADITGKTYSSGYTVASVWDGGDGFNWMKPVTFSEETVLYFTIPTWWNSSGCYHYVQFTATNGNKQTLPAYKLSDYTANNSATLSAASSGTNNDVYFVTLPAGTYFKTRLLRQKSAKTSIDAHNISGGFQVTTGTNNMYTFTSSDNNSPAEGSWSWVDHTSDATLTSNASDTKVNDTVTLTPGITNTKLNALNSGSYTVTIDGNAATLNTDYTLSGNSLVPKTVGEYKVTYTATYHAKGFTSKTGTASKSITFDVASDQVTHNVTFTNKPTGGTVTVNDKSTSPQAVAENENFTVKLTPNSGYTVNTFTVGGTNYKSSLTGDDTNGWTYTGNVGTTDKAVVATFSKKSYAVSWTNATNQHTFDVKVDGSSISNGAGVEYGKTVNVTVNGYDNSNGTIYIINSVTGQTLTSVSGSGTKTYSGSFTMPASSVSLTASSTATYRVTITKDANVNSVTVKQNSASGATVTDGSYVPGGTKLYVSAVMKEGYELNSATPVSLTKASSTATSITYTGTGSTGLSAPATVNVTSKKITQYTVTLETTSNITGYTIAYTKNKTAVSATAYSAPVTVDSGTSVTITATPKGRATISKWTVNGTDVASTGTSKTISSISANTTASATATKSSDIIYVKPASAILGGAVKYHHWGGGVDTDDDLWTGSAAGNANVYYDSAAGVFVVSGLTEDQHIQFHGGNGGWEYNTGDQQMVEFGKTYVITTDDNWTSSVKSLGDLTDETIIYVNKQVTAQSYTKNVKGAHVWWGDCQPLGSATDNLTNSAMPTGVTKETVQINSTDYWKITIPNYLFTSETERKFNITFFVDDWDPSETSQNYNLEVGKAYQFDITYNAGNSWDVAKEEVEKDGEEGDTPAEGNSDYYLDGYKHENGQAFSKVETKQMFTATLGSGTYSYYKVNSPAYSGHGDTGLSLFAVKTPESATPAISGTAKFLYLLGSDTFGKNDCYVGYSTDGTNFTEIGMTWVTNDGNNKIWKAPVPSNTTKIYFKTIVDGTSYYASNGGNNYTVASGEKMAYQVYGTGSFTKQAWSASNYTDVLTQGEDLGGTAASGNYYVWNTDDVYHTNSPHAEMFQSDGNLYNAGYDDGISTFDLPFHTNTTSAGYYVIVLHPNQTYTMDKDNETLTYSTSSKPVIYTSSVLPGTEMPLEPVKSVYAKDGALRNGYQRFSEFGETRITAIKDTEGTDVTSQFTHTRKDWESDGNTDYDFLENVPYGYTIEWTTTLSTDLYDGTNQFKNSHYVRGFSVNGVTEKLYEYSDTGVYTGSHVVSKQDSRRGHIEITPIYWLKNTTYTKTFYVEGFDRDNTEFRDRDWGDELGIYPYYENVNGAANAFGGYPGQPMIFYKGTYVQQIPTTVTGLAGGAKIKGMTLSNNYWDLLHREVNSNDSIYPVKHHRQTYDFDDFYEISNEKNPLSITFSYRLRTVNDNFKDGPNDRDNKAVHYDTVSLSTYQNTSTHNGTELYTDSLNRPIDLFGNVLTTAQAAETKLLVITNGYKNTYVGKYATEWAVYKQKSGDTYEYITSISPSALEINSSSKLSDYGAGDYTTAYTTLEAYKNKPVLISFEKSQENTTGDVADRLDGRWYYTKTTDQVEANIVIQYDDGEGYIDDAFKSNDSASNDRHVGTHTNASAYFTNVTPNDIHGDVVSGKTMLSAATQYFYLKAEESSSYQFVGWYTLQDGQYIPMEQETGVAETHTIIRRTETYYARFKKIAAGTLTVKHVIENGTINGTNYNGSGTPYLSAQITNPSGVVVANFPDATGSNFVNSTYIKSIYADYDVKVTIHTTPDEDNVFRTYDLNLITKEGVTTPRSEKATFFTPDSGTITSSGNCTFTFKVGALFDTNLANQEIVGLEYVSRLTKTVYNYSFVINYTFNTRIWNQQTYQVTGNIDPDRVANFIDGKQGSAKLKKSFLENMTPYESNYRKVIAWNYDAAYAAQSSSGSGTSWTITANVASTQSDSQIVHAEFKLPYEFDKTDVNFAAVARDFYSTTPDPVDKTAAECEEQYKADVKGDPDVNTYGTTRFATATTQTKTSVDGEASGVGYYDSNSSFTLTSQESHVFNTDNSVTTDRAEMKPVIAPDFVYYKQSGENLVNVDYHTYRVAAYYYSYDAGKEGYNYGYKDFTDGIVAKNNLVKKYFTRWDVYVDGKIITSCYSKEFNFTAYEDIVVVPVFDSDSPTGNVSGADNQGAKANIAFLGTTRNQWNVKGTGVSDVKVKKNGSYVSLTAADRLFADFDLEFADGRNVFETIDGSLAGNKKYEVGVVIEQLGDLVAVGGGYDTNASTYADLYKNSFNQSGIAAWVNGGSKPAGTLVKSVLGDNYGSDDTMRLDKNDDLISNKNTSEYYYYFTKTRTCEGYAQDSYNDYLKAYRAVSYVKIYDPATNSWTTTVSDSPAYFTIYDEAVRTK